MRRRVPRTILEVWRLVRRFERREVAVLRDWLEHTRNRLPLSVLVLLPLLIALVTYLSNAIDRLIEGVSILRDRFGQRRLTLDPAVEPIVAESIEYFGPVRGEDEARKLFRYPSIDLGTIDGGEAINTVPASARAGIDVRLAPGVDTPAILASIRECMTDCPGVTIVDGSWSVGSYEPAELPLVDTVVETAVEVTDGRVFRRSATGGGDAKTRRRAGVPTVDFAVAAGTAHAVDEHTSVPALAATAEVYTALPFALRERLE